MDYPISDVPLSIDTNPAQAASTISLDTNAPITPIDPEDAKKRAFRASFALNDSGIDPNYVFEQVEKGNEDSIREEAATKLNADAANKHYQQTQDFINSRITPLNEEDLKWIKGTAPVPYVKEDVIERTLPKVGFSLIDEYTARLGDEHFWNQFKKELTPAYDTLIAAGSEDLAWHMFVQQLRHGALTDFSNQRIGGQALDVAKHFLPFYSDMKNRANVKDVGFLDGILGSDNITKQRESLMAMPWAERIQEAKRIDRELRQGVFTDNPLAAALYWEKILGQSSFDRAVDDINTAFGVVDAIGIGQAAKGTYNFARLIRTSSKAMKDIKDAMKNYDVTKADIIASTGDIGKAGVEMASNRVIKEVLSGDVETMLKGLDELPRFFNMDMQNIRNSEALSEAQKNIILEQYEFRKAAVMKALSVMIRPHFPIEKAAPKIMEGIKEATKARYPSFSDKVVLVNDPKYVPLSNTFTISMHVGREAGKLFDDEVEAAIFARGKGLQVTLDDIQLSRFDNRIKDLEDRVNVRKAAPIEKFRQEAQSVEASLPPVPNGHTRLYRGNRPGEEGSNPVYTNSLDGIALPFRQAYGGKLTYIDVPEKTAQKYLRKSGGAPDSEFDLPASLAKKAQVVDYKRNARLMGEQGGLRMDDDVHSLNKYFDVEKELKELKKVRESLIKPGGYRIGQTGAGFHIDVVANLKTTDKIFRDFLTTSKEVYDPKLEKMVPNPNYRDESRLQHAGLFRWVGADWWRSAEDTFGAEARQARKAATYGQAVLYGLVKEEAKYLKDLARGVIRYDPVTGDKLPWYGKVSKDLMRTPGLSGIFRKDEWQTFKEVLEYSQKALDKDGVPGIYFETPDQLNYHYMHMYDRLPSFMETQAYFAVKRWEETDRILREVSLYSKMARLGAETHAIKLVVNGQQIMSPEFAGVSMSHMPKGRSNVAIVDRKNISGKGVNTLEDEKDYDIMEAFIIGDTGEAEVKDLARMSPKQRDEFFQLMKKDGYKLIRIADSEKRPLNGFVTKGDENIEYVLAKNVETKPLSWQQVPRRGGGHQVYDYEDFIKQANVVSESGSGTLKHGYEGDNTWGAVPVRAMGKDVAKRLNVFRTMLKNEDFAEAKAYARTWFDEPYEDMKARFYPKTDENGVKHRAQFNLNEEFMVVSRNTAIIDTPEGKRIANSYKHGLKEGIHRGPFIDRTREGSLMRNFQVEYTGERDARGLFAYENKGTVENPHYKTLEAERLSPLETLNRATSRIINSTLMDDYKMLAVENWVKEAAPYLKVLGSNDELIESSPYFYFKHPEWISDKSYETQATISKLMAARYKIDQLVGTPTFGQTWAHAASQSIADMVYEKFGPKASLTPIWLIDKLADGPSFLRSVAFHSQLGLFNVAQMFVQSATLVNVAAHSPRYAASATWASWLYQASRFTKNEKVIDYLDDMATKMQIPGLPDWKPGWFKEFREHFANTGFRDVGGEWGPLDVMRQTKTLTGEWGSFLHAGTFPMREGEKMGRIGAFSTAFLEFRTKNPLVKIGNAEKNAILDRADLLYNNMSVASHSFVNNPLLSLTTQFYTYAIRLGEIFFSKRIGDTMGERSMARARLLMANFLMFGMPMAPGVTATPLGDVLRQMAVEHGFNGMLTKWSKDNPEGPYVVGRKREGAADWIDHFIMEGAPATAIAMWSGEHPNFGERYGSGGMAPIRDLVFGDSSFMKWLGGVSGQITYNTLFNNTEGLFEYFRYMFNKSQGETYDHNAHYEPKLHDLTDLAKEVQVVNKFEAAYVAFNTGKWISKNGDIVKDVTPFAALMYTLTGTRPQEQSDSRHMAVNTQDKIAFQKRGLKKLENNINDVILSQKAGNKEQATDYMRRGLAVVVGYDLSQEQIGNAISRFFKNNNYSMVERIAHDRLVTHSSKTDPALRDKQHKAYRSIREAGKNYREPK